ncbi:MAG TPA: hypothetical protein VN708_09115 [Terriglobales bacterium]|jgi:hypothetical protein|nr:hypothetical protein [Terriglobales bacterium]
MKLTLTAAASLLLMCPGGLLAQAPANPPNSTPVSYTSISELNQLIANLQSVSQSAQQNLSHLRIEKWKTDSNTKKQTQSDTESILRNLQNALPSILAELKNSPESLALTFKTYRNLDALYDVMNSIVESAGAFGSKEEFQTLNNDLGAVEGTRRAFAERMDKLATAKENEIGQLRTSLQAARAAAVPPKKVVVDDTEPAPPKKAPVKKRPVPKPTTTPPASGTPPQ